MQAMKYNSGLTSRKDKRLTLFYSVDSLSIQKPSKKGQMTCKYAYSAPITHIALVNYHML